jgi:uncharacterized ion transporter superfamily protein YfcC
LVAALTWIIPAGQYERVANPALDREVPVAGTYTETESNPQGVVEVIMAPIAGLYDPATNQGNAIDVALFVRVNWRAAFRYRKLEDARAILERRAGTTFSLE